MKKVNIFAILGVFVVAFSMFSFALKPLAVGAQEEPPPMEERVDNRGLWGAVTGFVEKLTGAIGESIAQLVAKFFTGIVDFFIGIVCPQCTTSYEEIAAAPDIPDEMKLGLVGIVDQQVVAMFDAQPRIDVVAHLAEEWVPGYKEQQSVYASGYDDLMATRINTLWSLTRNIAYLGFVVVMIIVGFMIMFRNKVGGQTLVTVGNAIPKVVIGLVLVTFSFAIAGIILDISGVFMRVLASPSFLNSDLEIHNIWKLLTGTIIGGAGSGGFTLGLAGIATAIVFSFGPLAIIGAILVLIILGIVLFGAIKLWFSLVKTYFALLVNVIVAPLAIMAGSIPGNEAMTTNIFKSILRNALVFPLAFAIVNLPYFLLEQGGVTFTFPETVFPGASGNINLGRLMINLAKIVAIYVAAQAPAFMKAIIPATASKAGADAAAAVKEGFSKVPLVGGFLK
jgi:hypothetical protein